MEMEFFERELEATKKQVEEKGQKKTKGLKLNMLVRFCKLELKQGPNSPQIHRLSWRSREICLLPSIYQPQGIQKEMTWTEFKESAFYEMERQRWLAEKNKINYTS